jgi:hypothetical protein
VRALPAMGNMVMMVLTLGALVWGVMSYNETKLSNRLAQEEACREHPVSAGVMLRFARG